MAAFSIRNVSAQTPTPTPGAPGTTTTTPDQAFPGRGRHGGAQVGASDAELAKALGISEEQLQAAYDTAGAEALKEAVAKGLITQAQADQMSARGNRFLFHLGKPGSTETVDSEALLAKALNITTEQLQAARLEAFNASLDAALQAGTLTQAQVDQMKGMQALANDDAFQSGLTAAFEAQVKEAVTRGTITQAQADAILAAQAQNGGFFGRGFGPGIGRGPGFGGGHGGFDGPGFHTDRTAPSTDGTQPDALPTLPGTQNN
jgi:hypothetical protein